MPEEQPGGGPPQLAMLMQAMAGAGFDKVAGGISKLVTTLGPQGLSILESPQMKLLQVGAGLKDVGNSIGALMPFIQMLMPPPPPPPPEPPIPGSPQGTDADLMQALAAQLGPGQQGIQLPPPPPPGIGGGGPIG